MTTRKPKIPDQSATQPLLSESSTQRMAWERKIKDAEDEKGLIDFQRQILVRINETLIFEAGSVFKATVAIAEKAMDRSVSDADSIMSQGVIALDERMADLDKVIAGLTAAIGASE